MYALYEGSAKVGYESDTLVGLLGKLNWEKGEAEYGGESFVGHVDLYLTPDEWRSLTDMFFLDDSEYYEDEAERDRDANRWLEETGMPRELPAGKAIVYVEGALEGDGKYLLFDGPIELDAVNEALSEVNPDYGYRIVEE